MKFNLKKGLLVALMLVLAMSALAGCFFNKDKDTGISTQGIGNDKVSISGVVLDKDGNPIQNLTVVVVNENVSAKTNVQGKFNFGGIMSGRQVLQLVGEEGTGQVVINATRKMEPLTLTYPVITEVVILHDNDSHATINNFGKLETVVKQARAQYKNVYLFSAGDIFSGNPVVDQYTPKGKPMIDLMNAVGYNALGMGNHDFDYGQETLKNMMSLATFPMLSANTTVQEGNLPQPEPYTIFKTDNDLSVAVLGLIQVSNTSHIPATSPSKVKGLAFANPIETAKNFKQLGDNNLFVCLSHLGNGDDQLLAEAMPEMDVIIGAHSHTVVDKPYLVNGVLVAQSGSKNAYVGKIVITLKNGQVVSKTGELINLANVTEVDQTVQAMIDEYNSNNILDTVIGTAPKTISGKAALGNLMTQAMMEVHGADMGFQNNGGIRISSLSGNITLNNIYQLEPFANEVILYDMTTAQIRELLTYSVRYKSIDLQASGLLYTVYYKADNTIDKIVLKDYNGQLLDENRTYKVALNSFIAEKYITFTDQGTSTYETVADTIIEYIRNGGSLSVPATERGKIESAPIAETNVVLTTGVTSADRYAGSNTAGNLIADAIRAFTKTDIATFPGSNLVANKTVPVGPVSEAALKSLYNTYISSNKAVVAQMTGKDIKDFILARSQKYNNVDVQISGLKYDIYLNSLGKAYAVNCQLADGTPIQDTTVYTISFNNFAFPGYNLGAKAMNQYTTDANEQTMLLNYVTSLTGPIPASLSEVRVRIIK